MTIISHSHQLIFIAIPKTGTHSVRRALRPHLAETDEEHVSLFEKKRLPYPEFAEIGHGHLRATDLRKVLGEETWSTYHSFCVVRNPWERFVSYCAFITRKSEDFQKDPQATMQRILDNPWHEDRVLFLPQSHFVRDENGETMVDTVCRMERFEDDITAIFREKGLPPPSLESVNQSQHEDFRQYYTDSLRQQIAKRYQEDIERFGYSFS